MLIPTLSTNTDPALRKMDRIIEVFILVFVFVATCLVCCSCSSTRHVTQLVEHTSVDTVYLSNIQYDSIYIYQERNILPLPDSIHLPFYGEDGRGLYIKDKSIECRYKLLRDTIKHVERDSIPYQVTVTEVKEITRPLTWYDQLTRLTFWLVIGALLTYFGIKLRKLFNHLNF